MIYVIEEPDSGLCKIGVSEDPWRRRAQLQCGNAFPIRVALTFSPRGMDDESAERLLHSTFGEHRMSSEWFDVTPCDVAFAAGLLNLLGSKDSWRSGLWATYESVEAELESIGMDPRPFFALHGLKTLAAHVVIQELCDEDRGNESAQITEER